MATLSRADGSSVIVTKLVSTGIPGIDFLLGGGIPPGSIILIEESKYTNGYADVCAKLFLAEGLYRTNRLYFASDGIVPCLEFLQALPQAVTSDSVRDERIPERTEASSTSNMEIAWRYEHLPVKNLQMANEHHQERHSFDLSKPISMDGLNRYKYLTTYDARKEEPSAGHYNGVISQLKNLLFNDKTNDDHDQARWHRIFVRDFGSPIWLTSDEQEFEHGAIMINFLTSLRILLRQKSSAVALITISVSNIDEDGSALQRIRQLADVVLRLDPIKIDEKAKSTLDYHGFLRCLRTPSINSISHPIPDCADFAFKLKRKEFLIERLHLPPDLSETVSRTQLDCASSMSRSKLDF